MHDIPCHISNLGRHAWQNYWLLALNFITKQFLLVKTFSYFKLLILENSSLWRGISLIVDLIWWNCLRTLLLNPRDISTISLIKPKIKSSIQKPLKDLCNLLSFLLSWAFDLDFPLSPISPVLHPLPPQLFFLSHHTFPFFPNLWPLFPTPPPSTRHSPLFY